jgi:rhamnosyltransferase
MDISIVVLTKNAGDNFATLLDRLFAQEFEGTYEVLVIDSGSTDQTLSVAQRFPARTARIEPRQFHHGRTRNLGAEISNGRLIVYITQDALPLGKDWLQKLTRDLEEPAVAMVVGRQIPWQSTKPPEKFFYIYNFPSYKIRMDPGSSDYYHDNVFISNVNSAIRKDVWQRFRFSESIIMAEDKELAKRAMAAGLSIVYEPEAAVYHAHDLSLQGVFRKYVDFGISLRQGVDGLPRSRKSLTSKVLSYFTEEMRYLKANGYLKWLPYCMAYDGSRYSGMFMGRTGLIKRD